METNQKKHREVKTDLIDVQGDDKDTPRNKENIEKSISSNPTSKFEKKHGRVHNAFGEGHEPGTVPGAGI